MRSAFARHSWRDCVRPAIESMEPRRLLTSVSIVNQGVAHDSFGDTATGWTSYLITVNADAGKKITAIDFGQTTSSTSGIFGSLLQNWLPTKSGPQPTPSSSDTNGGAYGIDSHILVSSRVDATTPFENSNQLHPAGAPPNDASDLYGTGSYMHGVFGIGAAGQAQSVPFAYIVLPNGATGTCSFRVAQSDGSTLTLSGVIGASGSIAGTMFNDTNGDGVRQAGESPLVGWGCFDDKNQNGVFDSATETRVFSDASGNFQFTGLSAGTYRITQTTPAGWRRTMPVNPAVYTVTLAAGQHVTGKNIGDQQLGKISGVMFNDTNGNATRDGNEAALVGWGCFLDFNNNGNFDTGTDVRVFSDSSGNYAFNNLVPGTYHVHQTTPSGWRRTTASATYNVTLAAGGNVTARNFGNTQKVLISGSVFNDVNGDKIRSGASETGLSGWRVFVDVNKDGLWQQSTEPSTTTDSSGNWSFKTLAAGTFTIRIVRPAGWTQTTTLPAAFTLSAAQTKTGIVFGERHTG